MSFIQNISSFFTESDEENEEPQAGSRKPHKQETDTAGIPGNPAILANAPESLIVPLEVQESPLVDPLDAGSQAQMPGQDSLRASSFFDRFKMIFTKPPEQDITSLAFNPGTLSLPSLEGALRDVNITYEIDPPFQYVHIEFSRLEGTMVYRVVEPDSAPMKRPP